MSKKNNKKPNMMDKVKVENPKKVFFRMIGLYKQYKWKMALSFVCLILSTVTSVLATFMLTTIIDSYIEPLIYDSGNTELWKGFGAMLGIMAAIYVVSAGLHYVFNFIIVKVTTKIMQNVRDEMFEKMEKLPISFFDTHTHGELMSRYTNDTDTLRELLSNSIPNLISQGLTMVAVFCVMMYYSWLLTLILCLTIFAMTFLVKYISGKSGKHFMNQQRDYGKLVGFVEEHIDGLKVVKVFCHEDEEIKDFDKVNSALTYSNRKGHTYANVLMPTMNNLGYVNYAIVAIVGTLFCSPDLGIPSFLAMTVGKLIGYVQLTKQFSNPLGQMAQQANSILQAIAGGSRIFELIDATPEVDDGYVTLVNATEDENGNIQECEQYTGVWAWKHYHKAKNETTYVKWQGEVEFEDVTFGYVPEKTVLKGVNLVAQPGQKIALVGSTGAGKTTITNLVNRFYDINQGKIRYDGINITKISKDDLRRSMAMVLQDTHLFTGTVKDNIRFGKLNATDDEVYAAAKLANADYFITHLPDGYDTVITGDGANLSQGQRQLLAIARAAVANPPVLILDEATSSIDTRTEKLIEQGMDQLMQGRTVFVIAHRLSTVRNSDMILVIEHGEIIERGNHDQLIEQKGRYYHLYTGLFD